MIRRGTLGWTMWMILEAIILGVAGVLCCIFAGNKDFQNIAFIIVGVLMLVDAGLKLILDTINVFTFKDVTVVKTDYTQAITAAIEIAVGVVLIRIGNQLDAAAVLFKYLGIFIGVLLIVLGSIVIIKSCIFLSKKINEKSANFATIFFGLVAIGLGIVAIIFLTKQENFVITFLIIFGVLLIIAAVAELVLALVVRHAYRVEAKAFQRKVENTIVEEVKAEPKAEEPKEEKKENK